jgi:regulator of protease activity HflC (stomatin/prohibitin superfamily)
MTIPDTDSVFLWRYAGLKIDNWIAKPFYWVMGLGVILTFSICIGKSVYDIDEQEVAVAWKPMRKELTGVLEPGKVFISPDAQLITFDMTFRENKDAQPCVSSDGLLITLSPTARYRFKKSSVDAIVDFFGDQETAERFIADIVETSARNICGRIPGKQYYSERGSVERALIDEFRNLLSAANMVHASPDTVELRNIAMPSSLRREIESALTISEQVDVAINERQVQITDARTDQNDRESDVRITIIDAEASAGAILFDASQRRNARLNLWGQLESAIVEDLNNLQVTPEQYLVDFLREKATLNPLPETLRLCLTRCKEEIVGTGDGCWYCWQQSGAVQPVINV